MNNPVTVKVYPGYIGDKVDQRLAIDELTELGYESIESSGYLQDSQDRVYWLFQFIPLGAKDWAHDFDNLVPADGWSYCERLETNPELINL